MYVHLSAHTPHPSVCGHRVSCRLTHTGTPSSPADLYSFVVAVDFAHQLGSGGPILVHCSAGVGRTGKLLPGISFFPTPFAHRAFVTHSVSLSKHFCNCFQGTFCLALSATRTIQQGAGGWDNVPNCVLEMRKSRRYMVQTIEQYRFCYDIVLYAAQEALQGLQVTYLSELSPSVACLSAPPTAHPACLPVWCSTHMCSSLVCPPGHRLLPRPCPSVFVMCALTSSERVSVVCER